MLSLILNPLFKNSTDKTLLTADLEISLSMIESGCVFDTIDGKAMLIIVAPEDDVSNLKNINRVAFNFELIERPEFPSVALLMEINTASNIAYKFDYFFNTESPTAIELLRKLKEQNYFVVHFYAGKIVHSKKIEFGNQDKIEFTSLVDKVIA